MAYNLKVNEKDAKALVPEQEIIDGIVQGITQGSSILPLMRRLPDATSDVATMTVLDSLPITYWVDEGVSNGRKQTTNAAWKNKKLYMQEIAVIVPIKQNLLDDAEYDIFEQIKPLLVQDAYKLIDEAIILGKNKPPLFREGLIPSIINAGKNVAPASTNLYTQISNAMGEVEESGYDVNGLIGGIGLKKDFRNGLLDTTGQPLASTSEVMSLTRTFANNGAWDNTKAKFIVGDFNQAVYCIRKDVTFEMFDTGVITDGDGSIIYNLMQDDMVALRMTMRLSWEIPNPINIVDSDEETRFPFALVEPTPAPSTVNVTFTVKDGEPTPANISGAKVTFGGQVKKTGSAGTAIFKSFGSSDYAYVVEKDGYKPVYGKVAVGSNTASVAVTLIKED